MTISFEIAREYMDDRPPFTDGCENCAFDGGVVPFATITHGDSLTAFYHHGRCGYQWFTGWNARYSHTWRRVGGGAASVRPIGSGRSAPHALPQQPGPDTQLGESA